jgi:hypothetical protein
MCPVLVDQNSIHPRTKSEKACVSEHLANASKNDLIIYDRGYPAFWLYAFHLKHNHTFCMRAKTRQNLIIKDFIKSNKREAIVELLRINENLSTFLNR